MLTVLEARAKVLAHLSRMPAERVFLDRALFRVLAEDVAAVRELPGADVSMMDGYAVRAEDVRAASAQRPVALRVAARSEAGHAPTGAVGPGEAARVFTGAALPAGADAVVMQEQTRPSDGGGEVEVLVTARPGDFVRARGAELRPGERALAAGERLGPAQIALLAALGRSQVAVYQRPRVAVLTTGDELCELDEDPRARGGTVDSNAYGLSAMVEAAGAVAVRLGIARDDPDEIAAALEAARGCDAVITSAGVSVGERDHVRAALGVCGVELAFWRVAMKPGKPLAFGMQGPRPYFALPGNPTSAMVSFEQFVRPALLKMQGRRTLLRPRARARLEAPLTKGRGLVHFVRARAALDDDGALSVRPTRRQDSGLITSMAEANALIVLDADVEAVEPGAAVAVEILGELARSE